MTDLSEFLTKLAPHRFSLQQFLDCKHGCLFMHYDFSDYLVSEGYLTKDIVDNALMQSGEQGIPLSIYLIKNELINASLLAEKIAYFYKYPYLSLAAVDPEKVYYSKISLESFTNNFAIPLFRTQKNFFVGLCDPSLSDSAEFKLYPHLTMVFIVINYDDMQQFLRVLEQQRSTQLFDFSSEVGTYLDDLNIESIENNADDTTKSDTALKAPDTEIGIYDAPIVRFVHKIILDAVHEKCSDIHFDMLEQYCRVRYRKDGVLKDVVKIPKSYSAIVVSRIKVISRLDTTERRVPQDGRFKLRLSKQHVIDFRVNTCPNIFGEKVVMRILDPLAVQLDIDLLGLLPAQKETFLEAIKLPNSIILVTGPTGSGKTVTLYSLLTILNKSDVNICTVEDPVEFVLPGLSQTHVDLKTGLDFKVALRAFLRQDPDIMMVGEIRDKETVVTAIQAAQTGHLVLSTLHTNGACDAIPRLVHLGVDRYSLASSLSIVVAQRLLRKLCDFCKEPIDKKTKQALIEAGVNADADFSAVHIENPNGCKRCMMGYSGRTGIFEILKVTPDISHLIIENPSAMALINKASEDGMIFMRDSALEKVMSGVTSYHECEKYVKFARF